MNAIWVGGFPSYHGGADTELLNNIYLWRKYGIEVNLVPLYNADGDMRMQMQQIGCKIHKYEPNIFKNKITVSYCNGHFLTELPKIVKNGKPKKVIWFNCMTYSFPKELTAIRNDWIDLHGFVSDYQKSILKPELETKSAKKVRSFDGYQPYFLILDDMFKYSPPTTDFVVGRLSRPDPRKFSADTWEIFDKIAVPDPLRKVVTIMAYDMRVEKHIGPKPRGLITKLYKSLEIPVYDYLHDMHLMIHKTGGSRESYCRVVIEAYAHGVPVIVENDYAFPQLVIDGETGYRCETSPEMIERATFLSNNEEKRKEIVHNAHNYLKNVLVNDEKCLAPWTQLLNE